MTAVTLVRPPSSPRSRARVVGGLLGVVYLIGVLFFNLHIIDHCSTQGLGHFHHDDCADTEWSTDTGCRNHLELADHNVAASKFKRVAPNSSSSVLVVCAFATDANSTSTRLPALSGASRPRDRAIFSAPVRAPPADNSTV